MSVRAEIDVIESQLSEAGKDVAALCEDAGIARSTWTRWKNGRTVPNMKTWQDVQAAAKRLVAAGKDAA